MTQVSGLEAIVKELNISKQQQFDTLELKQAEVETSRAEMERMQNSTKELEFQLRESTERCALLEDQVNSTRGRLNVLPDSSSRATPSSSPSRQNSGVDLQRLMAEAEGRSEAKMSDLRHKIRSLEAERNEAEEEWAHKLQERVRDLDKLRKEVKERADEYEDLLRAGKEKDKRVGEVEERSKLLERELNTLKAKMQEAEGNNAMSADAEVSRYIELSLWSIGSS
jgi:chromosome segregation ATPase